MRQRKLCMGPCNRRQGRRDGEIRGAGQGKNLYCCAGGSGAGISLTISGMEDQGFSGTLRAVTDKVITAEEAALLAEQETDASSDRQTENGTNGRTRTGNSGRYSVRG